MTRTVFRTTFLIRRIALMSVMLVTALLVGCNAYDPAAKKATPTPAPTPSVTVGFTTPNADSAIGSANRAAFAVTGTCSEDGRPVNLSGNITSVAPLCMAHLWSASLNFVGSDGPVSVVASHASSDGRVATSSISFVLDTAGPTVTKVESFQTDGTYHAGQTIDLVVTFSESVSVAATSPASLTLETGTTDRQATFAMAGGNAVYLNYTIQPGDNTAHLDYLATNSLTGLVSDLAGNAANLTLPAPGAAGSLGANRTLDIDGIAPTVVSVSSAVVGTQKQGSNIDIQIQFSEKVNVTGLPILELETGAVDGVAMYSSGSGTNLLVFRYTVGALQNSADLDYAATTSLVVVGSNAIADLSGNSAVLTLPAPGAAGSLGANAAIVVDTTAPTIQYVAASTANGAYGINANIDIQVVFNENVTVTGTPLLALATGTPPRSASYISGTGTNTLVFRYTVQPGDTSTDLNYVATDSLTIAFATIRDGGGTDANLTLPALAGGNSLAGRSDIVIDSNAPTVLAVTSMSPDIVYAAAGQHIDVRVEFSRPVTVTGGVPYIILETGTTDRHADYTSGSGSTMIVFDYVVQAGDQSFDLDYVSATSFVTNGAVLRDSSLNSASVDLPSPGSMPSLSGNKNITIDLLAPTVLRVTSSIGDGTYGTDTVIPVQVVFSEPVMVTGIPRLTLETGGTDHAIDYSSGSGTDTLIFNYTVVAGDSSADLNYLATNSLVFNGGTIVDVGGNAASLTLPALASAQSLAGGKAIVISADGPTITGVTSSVANATYGGGAVIPIAVTVSGNVTVLGAPTLALNSGGTAVYNTSVSTSTSLVFDYTVAGAEATGDLDVTSVALNGGSIKDSLGNSANLTIAGLLAAAKAIVVETTVPTVTGVTTTHGAGTFGTGEDIDITVTFSENVSVDSASGSPYLLLNTTPAASAVYTSGSGTNQLVFTYTVAAGEVQAVALDYVDTASLKLNGGVIRDNPLNAGNGNLANVTLAAPPSGFGGVGIVIDAVGASVTDIASSDGLYIFTAPNNTVTLTLTFDQAVTVTGTPRLKLNSGAAAYADYSSGSPGTSLTFVYTVASGDVAALLNGVSLDLNGGSMVDVYGNEPLLTVPTAGAGSLIVNNSVEVDGLQPAVASISSASGNATYTMGAGIPITLTFDDSVTVDTTGGSPTLTMNSGGTATYVGGSGTTQLHFLYTVTSGNTTADLDVTSLNLNLATIRDANGNDAILATAGLLSGARAIVIDAVPPQITNLTSSTPDGQYRAGEVIPITATFSKAVTITGSPYLVLNSGGKAYAEPNDTALSTVTFTYTVGENEMTTELDATSVTVNSASGMAIQDLSGNNFDTAIPIITLFSTNKDIAIDSLPPTLTVDSPERGIYVDQLASSSIALSGTCEIDGTSNVVLSTNYATDCSGGAWSTTFDLSSATAGSVSIVVTHTDPAGNTRTVHQYVNKGVILSSGANHSCSLFHNALYCWGSNANGRLGINSSVESASSPVSVYTYGAGRNTTHVSSGYDHTCMVTSPNGPNRGVSCWGKNTYGQLGNADPGDSDSAESWVASLEENNGVYDTLKVASGTSFSCALVRETASGDTGVKCWGLNDHDQLGIDSSTPSSSVPVDVTGLDVDSPTRHVYDLVAGGSHACAVTDIGLLCWGRNQYGQLGNGSVVAESYTPVLVSGLTDSNLVWDVSLGNAHSCAVVNGAVKCWGYNSYGQLGNSSLVASRVPVNVTGLSTSASIVGAGYNHTCAVVSNGVRCWGQGSNYKLGNGTTTSQTSPVWVTGLGAGSGASSVSSGLSHSCAIVNGLIKCWGTNASGQVGNDGSIAATSPADVTHLGAPTLSLGSVHACHSGNGFMTCWGNNGSGRIGNNSEVNRSSATAVWTMGTGVISVAAGGGFSCGVQSGGVKCWGQNDLGQLGDNGLSGTYSLVPIETTNPGAGARAVSAGISHACAIFDTSVSGLVGCWGDNAQMQLGNQSDEPSPVPVYVSFMSGATAVASGGFHSCAIVGGAARCWGRNDEGQLGDSTAVSSSVPVSVTNASASVSQIATGETHSCAIVNRGVKCWGDNENGKLGDGTEVQRDAPVDVSGLTSGMISVAAGQTHSCAVSDAGAVWCWGMNTRGQLGDGSTTRSLAPVPVTAIVSGATHVWVGDQFTCAQVLANVMCWGDNLSYQLGYGSLNQYSPSPVTVLGTH